MSPLARSLLALAAAAAALLQCAYAEPPKEGDQCAYLQLGTKDGIPENLEDVYIKPGQKTASVEVPRVCPGDRSVQGLFVRACDHDGPTLRFENNTIFVSRNGMHCDDTATVIVSRTLWC